VKYVTEYRDPGHVGRLLEAIRRSLTRPWALMEVCGGQTHALVRSGLDRLLPAEIEIIHGPGCPVCVTPRATIDLALAIAATPGTILCSFGDMLRVPGSGSDLSRARAAGADVRIVSSPLDALTLARAHADREVVFLAVGFETTAPATAMAATLARRHGVRNFSLLVAHVLVPPALEAILRAPDCRVQAFLAAGHVCSVMGARPYGPLAASFRVPIVVAGFEPADLLEGIRRAVVQLEAGRAELENAYTRVVADEGNPTARALLAEVFTVVDRDWRGIGTIPASGWDLAPAWREFDARRRFAMAEPPAAPDADVCRAGAVLTGVLKPDRCPAFGRGCTPRTPLGAPMVSSEGACAAYYHAGRMPVPTLPSP